MSKPIATDDSNFEQTVIQAKTPVLVDFWAPWCAPCRMVAPALDELAKEYDGKIIFAKLNVDESPRTASTYFVMSIPTMILFKNGKPVTNMIGFKPKEQLKQELDAALA